MPLASLSEYVSIDATGLQDLKNGCSLLLDKEVIPAVLTVGYEIQLHAELLFKKFGSSQILYLDM